MTCCPAVDIITVTESIVLTPVETTKTIYHS